MGPLNLLIPRDSVCGIDSCVFIYLLADRAPYAEAVQPFLEAVHRGEISGVTSMIALTEVLAKPEQNRRRISLHKRDIGSSLPPALGLETTLVRRVHNRQYRGKENPPLMAFDSHRYFG